MKHEEALGYLDDYVDGLLTSEVTADVEAHLEECQMCQEDVAALKSLAAAAAALPRGIEPQRDLWPAIDRQLDKASWRERSLWSMRYALAAAAVALIVISSVLTTMFAPRGKGRGLSPETISLVMQWGAAERQYLVAFDALTEELELKKGELAPETIELIERNLRIIEAAIQGSREALAADPSNREMIDMLASIYDKKLELLRQVTALETRL